MAKLSTTNFVAYQILNFQIQDGCVNMSRGSATASMSVNRASKDLKFIETINGILKSLVQLISPELTKQ